jgi:1-acyl-sn-glycerol-3-phosphate acyltransferase
MPDEDERTRCIALTRSGERCKNDAQPGSEYCHVHVVLAESPAPEPPSPATAPAAAPTPEALRQQMAAELDDLIDEMESRGDYRPPPFSPQALLALIRESLDQLPPVMRFDVLHRLRDAARDGSIDMNVWQNTWDALNYWRHYQQQWWERTIARLPFSIPEAQLARLGAVFNEDLFDLDTWKGMWFMVSYSVKYQADLFRRRFTGEYETDEWGLDWEFVEMVRPFFTFFYKYYWRVETGGLEHIPDYGRALIVSNHSGQLPFDGAMIGSAVMLEHPSQRLVRNLYADWFPTLPFLAPLFEKMGQTLASVENGTRLLEQEELVAVYPEGYKGVGKLFKERYRLARFGRGGFVRMALATQAPIIPAAVVGAEETYISLTKSDLLAKVTGFPYFPISPTWPWLGLLGLIPLPTKWYIDFGEPIPMDEYPPDAADNLVLVSELTDQVRNIVQEMIFERLAQRRNVFLG